MDRKKQKESTNFVDLTGVTGEGWTRTEMLLNYLLAKTKNKQSLPNKRYESGLGYLQDHEPYPTAPTETPQGNLLRMLLTDPATVPDERQSAPVDPANPLYHAPWISQWIKQGSEGKILRRTKDYRP